MTKKRLSLAKHFAWFDSEFTKVKDKIPCIGETQEQEDPMVYAKFFYPDFSWTWYVIEFDGEDLFYGWVMGFENEFGTFSLSELKANRGKLGMPIEIDTSFEPCLLSKVQEDMRATNS